jgi:hypothetical protein
MALIVFRIEGNHLSSDVENEIRGARGLQSGKPYWSESERQRGIGCERLYPIIVSNRTASVKKFRLIGQKGRPKK